MTEEDTFKKLKGLTYEEAEEMYDYLHQLGMDSPTTITIQDVIDFVDERFREYGWTVAKLENYI
jgi:hypothetical protein